MLHSRMLRDLDEVARHGSIRKAAGRLNVASSSVNRQMLLLEAEVGTSLVERLPRKLLLTATGELLVDHFRQTQRGIERAEAGIEFRERQPRAKLNISLLSGPEIIAAVTNERPISASVSIRRPRERFVLPAELRRCWGPVRAERQAWSRAQ